jgi:regulation of enolase protein 1 (concanavalin A-like superfamily)
MQEQFMMSSRNLLMENDSPSSKGLTWFCPPYQWSVDNGLLILFPDAKTDFWQRTHYGFQNDNGHFFYIETHDNFLLTTKVRFYPQHQYDQAGLMVRISPDFWLKTSIEYEPDVPNRLGAVVTRHGYSDWSTQDISKQVQEYQLRIQREGQDFTVEYRPSNDAHWSQIRMAHLENLTGAVVQCGLYACSPIDAGFKAEFEFLNFETLT